MIFQHNMYLEGDQLKQVLSHVHQGGSIFWCSINIEQLFCLKGQCHEIFDKFLCLKHSTWASYKHSKMVSLTFSFLRRYLQKACVTVCQPSQQLLRHVSAQPTTTQTCVSVVNDHKDTMSAQSTTILTPGKLFYFGNGKKLTKKVTKM